jgi:hypothetical protein
MTTGENFDELADKKMTLQEVDENIISMLGELEPNIPNSKS